jgi:hypothetical protein
MDALPPFKPLRAFYTQAQWCLFMQALGYVELGVEGSFVLWDIRPVR